MNQLHSMLISGDLVIAGSTLGIALLVCSALKNNTNCTLSASILLMLTTLLMFPLLERESAAISISNISYHTAFYFIFIGAIVSLIATMFNRTFAQSKLMVVFVGALMVLIGFNIASKNSRDLKSTVQKPELNQFHSS
ncbi:MAG: hypothetical protein IT245_08215 [Bacteroidia bacterium]|nr:hypothetical protein [Bacteroidia bacterium]